MYAMGGVDGIIVCGREFMNSLDESSMAEVKAAIAADPWLSSHYEVGEKYIRTGSHLPGRVDFKFIGLRHNLASVKSKARILLIWVDEAEPVTDYAWKIVLPTLREEGDGWHAELWVTWNPEEEHSSTDVRFWQKIKGRERIKVVDLNWRDNPWFPDKLNRQRLDDQRDFPEDYDWIWEGDYRTHYAGAYFAEHLTQAKAERRIGIIDREPLMGIRTYHDLAGASDRADAYVIWVCQFVDKEIRVLDHYETEGQSPQFHITWMRNWCMDRGITRCHIGLPHDSEHIQIDQSWSNIWRKASDEDLKFDVRGFESGGKGAAMDRIRASQMHFHRVRFNEETTKAGRRALAAYHEKRDEDRNIGLGPNHNWASHSADAFGGMCIDYAERKGEMPKPRDRYRKKKKVKSSAWAR